MRSCAGYCAWRKAMRDMLGEGQFHVSEAPHFLFFSF